MQDKPISLWCALAVMSWTVCLGLMLIGTIAHSHTLCHWGSVAAAIGAVASVGVMATRQTKTIHDAALLRQDMERENVFTHVPRRVPQRQN